MRPIRFWFALLVLPCAGPLLAGCADDEPGQGCVMRTVAEMPVLNDHGVPIIRATINDTPVAFMVDTGARTSIVFESAAEKLGLPASDAPAQLLNGVGGSVFARAVTIRSLSLGTAAISRFDLLSVPGLSNAVVKGLPLVGLFGGDFLVNYDVAFDLPAHTVSLFEGRHCSSDLRPWPGESYRLPFDLEHDTAITLSIGVDGHPVRAMLDSGAERTTLDSEAGRVGGAVRASMAGDRVSFTRGIDGNLVESHIHRFDSLDIGPEHFAPAFLSVGDIQSGALLGADFFRARRIWISYAHETLAVQRVLFPKHQEGAPTLAATQPAPAPVPDPVPGPAPGR